MGIFNKLSTVFVNSIIVFLSTINVKAITEDDTILYIKNKCPEKTLQNIIKRYKEFENDDQNFNINIDRNNVNSINYNTIKNDIYIDFSNIEDDNNSVDATIRQRYRLFRYVDKNKVYTALALTGISLASSGIGALITYLTKS